jgi:cell division septal protein FtsQ
MTGYIVVLSPYFKISPNHVIIEPTPGIDIAIAYRTLESTYGESIFLVDEAAIARKLKNQLNNIASIDIRTVYPNGIKVLITGTPILFDTTITGIENKKWGLSKNGVLVPESDLE